MQKKEKVDIGFIQRTGWIIAIIGTGIAFLDGGNAAVSLFYGAGLSNISFHLLKRDLTGVLKIPGGGAKTRFLIKHYLKLGLIAVVLFGLIRNSNINKFYLLAGLGSAAIAIAISPALLLLRREKKKQEEL